MELALREGTAWFKYLLVSCDNLELYSIKEIYDKYSPKAMWFAPLRFSEPRYPGWKIWK